MLAGCSQRPEAHPSSPLAAPPEFAAARIAALVHGAPRPPRRATINVTAAMRLAGWTPQWLLDLAVRSSLR